MCFLLHDDSVFFTLIHVISSYYGISRTRDMCNRLIAIYLDMLAFSSNWVNYSKTGKKKELKVLLNLRRTPTSLYTYQGQHSWYFTWPTDQINRFFKAGRYGTINVKQKCTGFMLFLWDFFIPIMYLFDKKFLYES